MSHILYGFMNRRVYDTRNQGGRFIILRFHKKSLLFYVEGFTILRFDEEYLLFHIEEFFFRNFRKSALSVAVKDIV